MSFNPKKEKDTSSVKKAVGFLCNKPKAGDEPWLDMRTDIASSPMFKAISFYRLLDGHFKSPIAKEIANILERLSISKSRGGRIEAVEVLKAVNQEPTTNIHTGLETGLLEATKILDRREKK